MFIGVPSAPKCRTTSGTPVAATVSVSTMRAVPFEPACAKIIRASLSRRSPHEPLAAQRPYQTPEMSLLRSASVGAGADAAGTTPATIRFFPDPGNIRRHQLSFPWVDATMGAGPSGLVGLGLAATTIFSCGTRWPHQ